MKASLSPPKFFKSGRIGGGTIDRILNVPVAEIILYQLRVGPLIGQGKPAGAPPHLRMIR